MKQNKKNLTESRCVEHGISPHDAALRFAVARDELSWVCPPFLLLSPMWYFVIRIRDDIHDLVCSNASTALRCALLIRAELSWV